MRTDAGYRNSLRDGRRVWVLGEGMVDDVTTHPATAPMVACYAAWYDRHFDPQWQDRILTPPDDGRTDTLGVRHAEEHGRPAAYGSVLPGNAFPWSRHPYA